MSASQPPVAVRRIYRWDLDKTYLQTEFDTLRQLVRTAFSGWTASAVLAQLTSAGQDADVGLLAERWTWDRPLVEAADSGTEDEGRIRWDSRVAPWSPPGVDAELARVSEAMTTRLYRIEVDVRFPGVAGGERTISLATVRLAARDAPP